MKNLQQKIENFFAEYEARMATALADNPMVDPEEVAGAFTDCSIEASPKGVFCAKNDEKFRANIPKLFEFYRSIGTKSMKIMSLETTSLDDYHVMAKIHWQALYIKKDSSQELIDFDVIYFLQILNETPKIFAFITGDEEKVYQEKGLLPDQA